MLILSRYSNESVTITVRGVTIRIRVNDILRNKVRIAIDAPKEVHVVRSELLVPGLQTFQPTPQLEPASAMEA